MSLGSAGRRFGAVAQNRATWRDREWLGLTPAMLALCLTTGRCAQAFCLFAALVLGAVALVQILDAMLDRLRDWI